MDNNLITVTSPLLPNLDDFNEMLKPHILKYLTLVCLPMVRYR